MSRRGGKGGSKVDDKRTEFFKAVKNEKLDTLRWSLTHGSNNIFVFI